MRFRNAAALMLLGCSWTFAGAQAAPASEITERELCRNSLAVAADGGAAENFWRALMVWRSPAEKEAPVQASSRDLHFRIRSGFSSLPNCHGEGSSPDLQSWMPYPVGLVVAPVVRLTLAGRRFAIVESEYGLRLLVPADDLRRLEPFKTYIFPNDVRAIPYCATQADCSDHDRGEIVAYQHRYAVVP